MAEAKSGWDIHDGKLVYRAYGWRKIDDRLVYRRRIERRHVPDYREPAYKSAPRHNWLTEFLKDVEEMERKLKSNSGEDICIR